MTVRSFEKAVVAGYAELPVTKQPTASTQVLLSRAVYLALEDAGLDPADVDGLAVGGFTLAPDHAVNIARMLGLSVSWLAPQEPGGVGAISACMAAARAVESGDAEVVVCAAADALDTTTLVNLMRSFSSEVIAWLTPVGAHAANVVFALLQDWYMSRFGITRAEIGRVSVLQRANGARNPRALLKVPITLSDYLDSPPVAHPIHLLDCVHPGSGASAIVICREGRAPRGDSLRLLAGAERHNYVVDAGAKKLGWEAFTPTLLTAAGVDHEDVDVLELYDDYPFMVLWQLEELGFCPPGAGAAFVLERDLSPKGAMSLNTGGGMLAVGQAGSVGGYVPVVEAIRQLAGEGGENQARSATIALASGLGMVGYGRPLSVGALILGRI